MSKTSAKTRSMTPRARAAGTTITYPKPDRPGLLKTSSQAKENFRPGNFYPNSLMMTLMLLPRGYRILVHQFYEIIIFERFL